MTAFAESVVEQAALAWLESIGWTVRNGAEIALDMPRSSGQGRCTSTNQR